MDRELQATWGAWLQERPWDYLLTITFRDPLPPYRIEPVVNALGRTLRRFKPDAVFLGAEQHLSRMMHVHGLFRSGLVKVEAQDVWAPLFDVYGRSTVSAVRSQQDVAAYVTKYCTKALAYYQLW